MAKPLFEIKKNKEGVQLLVQGDLKVQHANDFKDFLLESMNRASNEKLMLGQVTGIDVTGVQLTYLWKKSLRKQGREATIELPENESLKELLEKTGITNTL